METEVLTNSLEKVQSTPVKLLVTTVTLMDYLDCGRKTAVEIGHEARAQVRVGRRLLWNVKRIQEYLDNLFV